MNIQQGLAKVIERQNLTTEEMVAVMNQVLGGGDSCSDRWLFSCLTHERRNH